MIHGAGHSPTVAREGKLFFIRRIHSAGRQRVISMPREVLERANLSVGDVVTMWIEGETVCFARYDPTQLWKGREKK